MVVVAPASPPDPDRLAAGCAILRGWGLDVAVAPHAADLHPRLGYLAGADADRAGDLCDAWQDPTVAAVLCARGGYGAQRVAELLDWAAMRLAEPKALVGFSDITALHAAFTMRLGVATIHGPSIASLPFVGDAATAESLRRTLFEPDTVQTITSAGARTLVPGTARGLTMGGCLSLLAADVGTPTQRDACGGIVLLEDVGEKLYRVDRYLTQLLRAGWFDGVAGIALGSWRDCGPGGDSAIDELVIDRLGGLNVPIAAGLGFGHDHSTLTVPLGVPAILDADAATLTLEVPALTG